MASLGTISVNVTAVTKGLTAGLKRANDAMQSFGAKAGIGFAAMTAGIYKVIDALETQRQAEARLEAAVAGAGAGLGINTENLKAYAAELQNVTSFGDEATISATGMLASFALTEDQLMTLMPRMQNLAAFTGGEMNAAAMQMGKALTVSASVLSKSGIIMSKTQKAAFDLADQQEKVALLAEIIDQNVGNAATTMAKTAGGAIKQATNAFGDLEEELGKILEAPVAALFRDVLTPAINKAIDAVKSLTPEMAGFFAAVVAGVTGLLGAATALAGLGAAISLAWSPVIAVFLGVVAAIAALVAGVPLLKNLWERNFMDMRSIIEMWKSDFDGAVLSIQIALKRLAIFATKVNKYLTLGFADTAKQLAQLQSELTGLEDQKAGGGTAGGGESGVVDTLVIEEATSEIGIFGDAIKDVAQELGASFLGILPQIDTSMKGLAQTTVETKPEVKALGTSAKEAAASIDSSLIPNLNDMAKAVYDTSVDMSHAFVEGASQSGEMMNIEAAGDSPERIAAVQEMEQEAQAFTGVMQGVGNTMTSAMGEMGDVVRGAIEGSAGGPIGAIIGAILALVMKLQPVVDSFSIAGEGFGVLIEALNPLMEFVAQINEQLNVFLIPLFNMLGILFSALGDVLQIVSAPLGYIMNVFLGVLKPFIPLIKGLVEIFGKILGPVLMALGQATKAFGIIVAGLGVAFGWVVNAMIDVAKEILMAAAKILSFIPGAGNAIRSVVNDLQRNKVNMWELENNLRRAIVEDVRYDTTYDYTEGNVEDLGDAIGDLTPSMEDLVPPVEDLTPAFEGATPPIEELGKAAKEASESLTNVPSGYKLAMARMRAIETGSLFGPTGTGVGQDQASGGVTVQVHIDSLATDNPEDFVDKLSREAAWGRFAKTGTSADYGPAPGNT